MESDPGLAVATGWGRVAKILVERLVVVPEE
jgi:hypothetical protein